MQLPTSLAASGTCRLPGPIAIGRVALQGLSDRWSAFGLTASAKTKLAGQSSGLSGLTAYEVARRARHCLNHAGIDKRIDVRIDPEATLLSVLPWVSVSLVGACTWRADERRVCHGAAGGCRPLTTSTCSMPVRTCSADLICSRGTRNHRHVISLDNQTSLAPNALLSEAMEYCGTPRP